MLRVIEIEDEWNKGNVNSVKVFTDDAEIFHIGKYVATEEGRITPVK